MVINRYEFSLADDGAEPFCFVEQARFKFKEDIRFYTDESKSTELLRIKARQRFDPRATYDVTGADGGKIGEIQKVFGRSLFRSTYAIDSPGGSVDRAGAEPDRGAVPAARRVHPVRRGLRRLAADPVPLRVPAQTAS